MDAYETERDRMVEYQIASRGIKDPRVALLNIGGEEKKGSELAVQSHNMLKQLKSINFSGNIEGREIFQGEADVVVTDGFTGNVILKAIEGKRSAGSL